MYVDMFSLEINPLLIARAVPLEKKSLEKFSIPDGESNKKRMTFANSFEYKMEVLICIESSVAVTLDDTLASFSVSTQDERNRLLDGVKTLCFKRKKFACTWCVGMPQIVESNHMTSEGRSMFYPMDIFTNPTYSQEVVDWAVMRNDDMELNRPNLDYDKLCKVGSSYTCSPAALPGFFRYFPLPRGKHAELIESATKNPLFSEKDGDRFIVELLFINSIDDIDLYTVFPIDGSEDCSYLDESNMRDPSDASFIDLGYILKSGKLSAECLNNFHTMFMGAYEIFTYEGSCRDKFDYFKTILECPIATDAMIIDAIKARYDDLDIIMNTVSLIDDLILVLNHHPDKARLVLELSRTFGNRDAEVNKKEIDLLFHVYFSDCIDESERKSIVNIINDQIKALDLDDVTLAVIAADVIGRYKLDVNPAILNSAFFKSVIKNLIGDDYISALNINDLPNLKLFSDPRMGKAAKEKIYSISSVNANYSDNPHPKFVMTQNGEIVNITSLSGDEINFIAGGDSTDDRYLTSVKLALLKSMQMPSSCLSDMIQSSRLTNDFISAISMQNDLTGDLIEKIIKLAHSTTSIELLAHKNASKKTIMSLIDISLPDHIEPYHPNDIAEMFSMCNQLSTSELYELFDYCRSTSHNALNKELTQVFAIKFIFSEVYCKDQDLSFTEAKHIVDTLRYISDLNTVSHNDLALLEPHLTLDIVHQLTKERPFTTSPYYAEVYERLVANALKERVEMITPASLTQRKNLSL